MDKEFTFELECPNCQHKGRGKLLLHLRTTIDGATQSAKPSSSLALKENEILVDVPPQIVEEEITGTYVCPNCQETVQVTIPMTPAMKQIDQGFEEG